MSAQAGTTNGKTLLVRLQTWWSNPWGKPRFLVLFTWLYVLWSLVPVAIAVLFGFNAGRSRSTWQGFSLRWYYQDPDLSVLHDPSLRDVGTPVQASVTKLGTVVDLSKLIDQTVSHYTSDAGNHVSMQVGPAPGASPLL